MNLLHRYIFRSVGIATLTGIGLFAFVLIAGNAVRDVFELLASGQLSITIFARLLGLLLPWTISFAAPLGLLIAILLVLGRMSARNEIVALKSAGVSIWRISAPILFLAMLVTLISAYINNYPAPTVRTRYRSVLETVATEDPLRFFVPGRFIRDFPGLVIFVGDREGSGLRNVRVISTTREGQALRLGYAPRGEVDYIADTRSIVLTLYDASVESRGESNPDDVLSEQHFGEGRTLTLALPVDSLLRRMGRVPTDLRQRKPSNMNLSELLLLRERYDLDIRDAAGSPEELARLEMERTRASFYISRNFAFSFSSLALAMLAIPLGIKASRTETYANLGIAVSLALFYYFLIFLAGMVERNPAAHPELLVWLPNIAFQAMGFALMRRSNLH